jgi:DNA helicase HerA-like ATPase
MLGLNETQGGVLALAFKIADDAGLLLLDFKDLRALLEHVGNNAKDFRTSYGNVSTASVGAIQRGLLQLESQGGEFLLGEPSLDIADLIRTDELGRGVVNVLAAEQLLGSPRVYSTFLLWLLSEIFERMPEVGDPEKPRLVFFFDEAHLLFDEAPKAVLEKIEQVVRLVRSKGVGVWFVTQNPLDIPDTVLGQLGNRVQHALRAYTPRDLKAVKTAAETLRPNPKFDSAEAIGELGVGEALVSLLDEKGRPRVVERAFIAAPGTRMGTISEDERRQLVAGSALAGKYDETIDRESAYERLKGRTAEAEAPAPPADEEFAERAPQALPPLRPRQEPSLGGQLSDMFLGSVGPRGGQRPGILDSFAKSALRSAGSSVGREITRGLLGSLFGGRRR